MAHGFSQGIALKKRYSQVFLRDSSVLEAIISAVELDNTTSVFEIGCGEGFLTKAILRQNIARLWVFEIDPDWVLHVKSIIHDARLTVLEQNILDYDFTQLEPYKPWVLLANLPYQVTFPILYTLQRNRHLVREGVVMVQEEVAQKIIKTSGRGYGYPSLFLQRYFEWRMLRKVAPSSFYPAPKVFSRLMYFKTRTHVAPIEREEEFWKFVKVCFHQPRRTLKNNLAQSHYVLTDVSHEILGLRAQQMNIDALINLWGVILRASS